jgi:hypothetical protein
MFIAADLNFRFGNCRQIGNVDRQRYFFVNRHDDIAWWGSVAGVRGSTGGLVVSERFNARQPVIGGDMNRSYFRSAGDAIVAFCVGEVADFLQRRRYEVGSYLQWGEVEEDVMRDCAA